MLGFYKALPEKVRSTFSLAVKVGLTVGAFYLLLTHSIDDGQGNQISIAGAIAAHVGEIELVHFLPLVFAAAAVKFVGILSSMFRWHLLLQGQGIRFNFGHIFGSFLIGRFLGTFLPSTVGLDSYKLYDAAKFSERVVEPAAATAVEKVMGLSGLFLTFLVTLPLGYPILYDVLGDNAAPIIGISVAISLSVVGGLFLLLFRPGLVEWCLRFMPAFGRHRVEAFITRVSHAATAYRGKGKLLLTVISLSFVVHFATAVMYYPTALAVGAVDIEFWYVAFGSSVQIFATVLSPITIGGEGIREAAQMVMLQGHMGTVQAVLSAALGFWAAEAPTLFGAFFWWGRRKNYAPKVIEITAPNESNTESSAETTADPESDAGSTSA